MTRMETATSQVCLQPARESHVQRDLRGLVLLTVKLITRCEPKAMTSDIFFYASYYKNDIHIVHQKPERMFLNL